MKKTLALAFSAIVATGGIAGAQGESDTAKLHPGHKGYVASENKGGGVPTSHFGAHGGPGYPAGPGGWGGAVSETAKTNKGIPNAHPED